MTAVHHAEAESDAALVVLEVDDAVVDTDQEIGAEEEVLVATTKVVAPELENTSSVQLVPDI